MNEAALKPSNDDKVNLRACVLLPYPLESAYDYRIDEPLPRGMLVVAPLGSRDCIGVVWGESDGTIPYERMKRAEALAGHPRLPQSLCDFIDWTARYTLAPPGLVLAMALRVRDAFEAEKPRIGFARGTVTPSRMTEARARVLALAADGLARSVTAFAEEANVTPQPEFLALACPDPAFAPPILNAQQAHAADELCARVAAGEFSATLLDGVTGSGKTETYFEAVAEALRQDRQVLILLPEIALTVQFLDRFAARFGCRPA
jgi:primosomal protein N' (replication factor Y)